MSIEKIIPVVFIIAMHIFSGCLTKQTDTDNYQSSPSMQQNKQSNQHGGSGNIGSSHHTSISSLINQVRILPKEIDTIVGNNFTINITCEPIQPIKGWELTFTFDPMFLRVIFINQGNFFDGYETFPSWNIIIDNENGIITRAYNLILGNGSTDKNGTLLIIQFTSLASGTASLNLETVGLANESAYVPIEITNGIVHVSTG